MQGKARTKYVVGNWKMYKTIDEALSFIDSIKQPAGNEHCHIFLAVPFTAIHPCFEKVKGSSIVIGAQNMNDATEGAFTGEVSASMIKDAGASFVILGHSERRKFFHETDEFINKKVKRALDSDLTPILCIGENFDEREAGKTHEVLKNQLTHCLEGVHLSNKNLIIAYEPIWAIGTGKAATPELVEETHKFIRQTLEEILGKDGLKVPLLYGGSVNGNNAQTFVKEPDIDGLLVGSASLHPESFAKIIQLVQNS